MLLIGLGCGALLDLLHEHRIGICQQLVGGVWCHCLSWERCDPIGSFELVCHMWVGPNAMVHGVVAWVWDVGILGGQL